LSHSNVERIVAHFLLTVIGCLDPAAVRNGTACRLHAKSRTSGHLLYDQQA
jgi:hypothetical protein